MLNFQDNCWKVFVHIIAIGIATIFWILYPGTIYKKSTSEISYLDSWLNGLYSTDSSILKTFIIFFAIFLIVFGAIEFFKFNISERGHIRSIVLGISDLASNILNLILVFGCSSLALGLFCCFYYIFVGIFDIPHNNNFIVPLRKSSLLIVFSVGFLIAYLFLNWFVQYKISKFKKYISSETKLNTY
ncbi:hypothetical protein ACT4WM_06605 [Acinetobacter baumannii]